MAEPSFEVRGSEAEPAACRPRGVVLGIGNTLLRDESAGIHVVDALRHRDELDGVALVDGGTLSVTLLDYVEMAPALIVVDAGNIGAVPGALRSFEGEAMDAFLAGASRRRTVHEIGLLDLLAIARLRDLLPAHRALVCIQPAEVGWGLEPTLSVAAAVPAAADEVVRIFRRWQA